ncbi:N-acetyltransferase family protein [Planktotalea sp.]|uniref:GNAT family N-acetyltransferase n=1 Tax=Planktotalea sp. TaxID=2029877 RepID=UPI003D6AD46B
MSHITTRIARAQDAPDITKMISELAAIHNDIAEITTEDLVFLCFGPAPWLTLIVAENDGVLRGYAAVQRGVQLQFARRFLDVQHLYVAQDARRMGVGRALMDAADSHAALHRCVGLSLGVMAQNAEAQAFYRALGFEPRQRSNAVKLVRALGLQSAGAAP